ncbi:MAG: coproporphyrinogen-III oxidase family protein [Spirochaetota bacterium]
MKASVPVDEAWQPPRSLYIHIPFCRSKCSYCDFFSIPQGTGDSGAMDGTVKATIVRARELAGRFGSRVFDTVYVGGGTPSVLPRPTLRMLLSSLAELAPHPLEWTVEANPESIDGEFLDILEESGVNRLSIGVQSLDRELLALLERPAGAEASIAALRLAASRKFRLSADLIAGLPRRGGILGEARALVEEGLGHLSVYDLVLEAGTRLEGRWKKGEFVLQSEDEALDERGEMESWLATRGFSRYEISNYALQGSESLHNSAYWRMDSYLGAGPGAVSTIASAANPDDVRPGRDGHSLRIEESRSIEEYRRGKAAETAREQHIGARDSAFEALMMAFRTAKGLDEAAFASRFRVEAGILIEGTLKRWRNRVACEGGRIALDPVGLDLGNGFLADCLLELETSFPADPSGPSWAQTKKS